MLYLTINILVLLLLDFIYVAFFRRLKKGKFNVIEDSPKSYTFQSNVGEFRIDRENRELRYAANPNRGSIPFGEISKIEYRLADNWAWIQELFFGFGVMDIFGRYQDSDYWYTIYVVSKDGQRLPVFVAGQHKQREFLMTWYINLQQNILERLGLFRDVHDYSALMLDELRDAFADSELDLRMRQ